MAVASLNLQFFGEEAEAIHKTAARFGMSPADYVRWATRVCSDEALKSEMRVSSKIGYALARRLHLVKGSKK